MKRKMNLKGLGLTTKDGKIWCYFARIRKNGDIDICLASSENGTVLYNSPKKLAFTKNKEDIVKCEYLDISKLPVDYFMAYCGKLGSKKVIYGATSSNLFKWEKVRVMSGINETGILVPEYLYNGRYVMYFGKKNINIAFSDNLKKWDQKEILLKPRKDHFDSSNLVVGQVFLRPEGIVLIYYAKNKEKRYTIGAVQFDRDNPIRIIWRSERSLWEQPREWDNKKIRPIGIVELEGELISYWENEKQGLIAVFIPGIWFRTDYPEKAQERYPRLERVERNPILAPCPHNKWESKATFNPTAVFKRGKVHIIYRAIGEDDVSRLGYAVSKCGTSIEERHHEPIYGPTQPFEGAKQEVKYHSAVDYMSGGGWGGCEDPRITEIEDRLYLTYVAYDGCNPPRVALSSISVLDFRARCWNWTKPVLISPPGVVDKNACILPEKVNGQFVIFHRIYPNILIDYVTDLDFDGKTKFLRGDHIIPPVPLAWDSKKVGIGPTPIKTKYGWLAIYQAVGYQDTSRYKIGAMLLDLNDLAKVLYRSRQPILEPIEWYENEGHKSGVVYPCGAVIKDGQLIVYYGGADSFVCAASAPIDDFLNKLINSETPHLDKVTLV